MKHKNLIIGVLVAMIFLIMAVEMFFMVRQNHELKAELQKMMVQRIGHIEPGSQCPDFKFRTINGREVSLSDYSGRNLLLIFFSTECPGCVLDIPNWKRLMSFKSDSLDVLGISKSPRKETQDFLSSYVIDFDAVIDDNGAINEMFKCQQTPQKILIDKDGTIEMVEETMVSAGKIGILEKRFRGQSE